MRRRTRRGYIFRIVLFLVYSSIKVLSSDIGYASNTAQPDIDTELSTLLSKPTVIPSDDVTVFLSTQETLVTTTFKRKYCCYFAFS